MYTNKSKYEFGLGLLVIKPDATISPEKHS